MNKCFSQSSLRDYLFCPYKYKLKYIDKIFWFKNDKHDSLKKGLDFHINAERYFLGNDAFISDNSVNSKYIENLKESFPINKKNIYLPEYELNYNENGIKLKAIYDLLILKDKEIHIIDIKTNKNKIEATEKENDIQTKVYTFVLANCLALFKENNYSLNDIKMFYWQPDFPNEKIIINYSFEKHLKYKSFFSKLITKINQNEFEQNKDKCQLCEFNFLCRK